MLLAELVIGVRPRSGSQPFLTAPFTVDSIHFSLRHPLPELLCFGIHRRQVLRSGYSWQAGGMRLLLLKVGVDC